MKKLLLLLLPLLLFMACPLEEEEDPAPYNGTWVGTIDYVERTLTLDNDRFTDLNDLINVRGSIEEVDSDTVTLTVEEMEFNGTWLDASNQGFETKTYDWVLNEAGDKLTITDVSDQSVSVLTKK